MDPGQPPTSQAPGQTRTRVKWIGYGVAGVGVLLLLYTVCGFWLAPALVKRSLPRIMTERLGLTASVERVSFNPFSFSAGLSGFSAEMPGEQPLLSFADLYVNVDPWSVVFGPTYHIQEIVLQGLDGRIIRNDDGRFNFDALLTQTVAPKEQNTPEQRLPALSVTQLRIDGGRLRFADLFRKEPFRTELYPINLALNDFSTRIDTENGFALTATLADGGTVDVKGRLSLTPPGSDGRILVKGLPLRSGWEYIRQWVRFEITAGSVDVSIPYAVAMSDAGLNVDVDNAAMALSGIKVTEKGGEPDPVILIPSFAVEGLSADLKEQSLRIERIVTRDAWVNGWLTPDGELGMASVLALEPVEGQDEAVASIKDTETGMVPEWQVSVNQFLLVDAAVDYEDRTLPTPFRLQLKPIRFELNQLSNRRNEKARLNMSVKDAAGGTVAVSGHTSIQPVAADLNIRVDNVSLTQFEAYLSEIDNLKLESGSFHSDVNLKITTAQTAEEPQLRLSGRLGIKDLTAADATGDSDLFQLKALDISGIEFQERPNRLNIADIAINQPAANLVVYPDGRINVTETLKPKPGAEERIQKSLLGRIANAVRLHIQGPVPFKIDRITLEGGKAAITDQSIDPGVSLNLEPYRLNVSQLDSVDSAPATADLNGSLGGGADLKASGRFNPFRKDQPTEMDVSLDNFDLTVISPYAGRYAGYGIDKGHLSLGLNYTISQRLVDGTNQIRLMQLTLGEPTGSPDAIDLPLPLAVALLKNRKGNINLNLPLEGDLDDPQFQIGGVVTRTLVNLITSVVTSPFSVLGSIAGAFSAEELQRVGFEPGGERLEADEVEKLNTLAEALKDRPALNLQIKGTADRRLDREALARRQLLNRIDAMSPEELKAAGITLSTPPRDIEPGSPAYQRALIMLYRQQFEALPEAFDENDPADVATVEEKLIQGVSIERNDLVNLARRRAERIKTYLIEEGAIGPDRLFIEAGNIVESTEGGRIDTELGVST